MNRSRLGVVAMALLLGCGTPTPPPPPPQPSASPAPAPAPPPPKCEALKEQCKAAKDTKARIPGTSYVFTPPEGWIYAQLEEVTVAQAGEEGPLLMLTTHAPDKDMRKSADQRVGLVKSLAEIVLLQPPARFVLFKMKTPGKDDYAEKPVAGVTMSLWERGGGNRGKDKGPLLIAAATVADRELLAVGFAPEGDQQGTGAILSALQTLTQGESAEGESASSTSTEAKDEGK